MPEDGRVVQQDGTAIWYKNGVVHRNDGPAIERADGSREWYSEGVRHNYGGPAITSPDGKSRWFRQGKEFAEAEFIEMRRREDNQIDKDFQTGTLKKMSVRRPLKLNRKT